MFILNDCVQSGYKLLRVAMSCMLTNNIRNTRNHTHKWWRVLNRCPRMKLIGQGYFSQRSRYSLAASQTVGLMPSNMNGFWRFPSADITPQTPVSSMHRSTSRMQQMLPLANTGTLTLSRTFLMIPQSATPVNGPFISRVLPWIVKICAPARSNIWAYSIVFSSLSKRRILQVTGTRRCWCKVLTNGELEPWKWRENKKENERKFR